MLWEPHIEGRNAHATFFEIYLKDPFLLNADLACIPLFVIFYQTFRVLSHIGHDKAFSPEVWKALQIIKFCALSIIGFTAIGEIFILLNDSDDRTGGFFMGMLITLGSLVIAATAAMFQRIFESVPKL